MSIIAPQPGPQAAFLASPANECLFGGARGGGKTHGILLDWLQHMLQNPKHARGVLFRRSYPELENVIDKSIEMFPEFGASYSYTKKTWKFSAGATLKLRHLDRDSDAARFQGHEHTYIAIDEAGSFPTPEPIWKLKATLRNVHGIRSRLVLSANPGGAGQGWIKERYITDHEPYELHPSDDDPNWLITYIPSKVWDNPILLKQDPGYINRLRQVGADWLIKAWMLGDWSVVPGMYLEGVWDANKHVVRPFKIPSTWRRWRAMDWGYAKPYAIGWYAQDYDGNVYLYRELYGRGKTTGEGTREEASLVARRVIDIEAEEISEGIDFLNNPADSSCWMEDGRYKSIASIFHDNKVFWSKAAKGPGSRVNGAQEVIRRLATGTFRVFSTCSNFLRTVPAIPADTGNPEDVDTDAEDHHFDQLRYSLMSRQPKSLKPPADSRASEGTYDHLIDTTQPKRPPASSNPYGPA